MRFDVAFLEGGFKLVLVEDAYGYVVAPFLSFLEGSGFLLQVFIPVFHDWVQSLFPPVCRVGFAVCPGRLCGLLLRTSLWWLCHCRLGKVAGTL